VMPAGNLRYGINQLLPAHFTAQAILIWQSPTAIFSPMQNMTGSTRQGASVNEEVVISSAGLDLSADNYEEFDAELDPARFGDRLSQGNVLRGSVNDLQIYDTQHLLVSSRDNKHAEQKDYRLNLAWCDAEPQRQRIVAWKWLYLSLGFLSLFLLDLGLAISEIIDDTLALYAGAPLLTVAIIFLLIFVYCLRDRFIFCSRYGGTPLFLVENGKPSQSDFDRFFINLQQNIEQLQAKIPVRDQLVGELQMCRRLKDEGIIPEQAYTSARSKIFKHEEYSG